MLGPKQTCSQTKNPTLFTYVRASIQYTTVQNFFFNTFIQQGSIGEHNGLLSKTVKKSYQAQTFGICTTKSINTVFNLQKILAL